MKKTVTCAVLALTLSACANGPTPAQLQQDLNLALEALRAAGCAVSVAGAAAGPIIAVTSDARGNRILQATTATGAAVCAVPAPAAVVSPAGTTLGAVIPGPTSYVPPHSVGTHASALVVGRGGTQ